MSLYFKSCPFIKLDKDTWESDAKVEDSTDKVELVHFEPLYCNTWPDDKFDIFTSVLPDKVDVKLNVELVHFPLIYCNIWFDVGDIILKSLINELFINVFSHKTAELL